MKRATSSDGTPIAYERAGDGPLLILVGGGLDDGAENARLVPELAPRYSVVNYARRGRGESGDTLPYAVERELEDIEALIAAAGGPAHLYGVSSGGALALEAAAAGLAVDRLAVYEVPYVAVVAQEPWRDYVEQLGPALAQGRRDDALELFMRMAGSSEEGIAGARSSPLWPGLRELAPTLAYDAACLGDGHPPTARLAEVGQPALVITGGGGELFERSADAIAAALPNSERVVLEGQSHVADPRTVAALLERFLGA